MLKSGYALKNKAFKCLSKIFTFFKPLISNTKQLIFKLQNIKESSNSISYFKFLRVTLSIYNILNSFRNSENNMLTLCFLRLSLVFNE